MTAVASWRTSFDASSSDPEISMHGSHADFLAGISGGPGRLLPAAGGDERRRGALSLAQRRRSAAATLSGPSVARRSVIIAPLAMSGMPLPTLPHWFVASSRSTKTRGRSSIASARTALLVAVRLSPRFFVAADGGLDRCLNLALVVMGLSMVDHRIFTAIVTKPDNVPIVGLVFLLGFFTWLATAKAVKNDDRLRQGLPPLEKLDNEKVLVWPDLVYTELICMIALTAFLLVWAHRAASPAGRAGQPREDAESVEGPVVLPRPAGNARLLRSVDGRRRAAEPGASSA